MSYEQEVQQSTGVKYLNIDYRKRFKNNYVVRVVISGKHFVVWKGDNFDRGEVIAKKVQELMAKGKAAFLDWYDNDREDWLKEHGYTDANK